MLTPTSNTFIEKRQTMVFARCSFCGKETKLRFYRLETQQSCGCQQGNHTKGRIPINKTHGKSKGNRLYNVWNNIKGRCNCVTNPAYKYYGGKGVKLCDAWRDFSIFQDWCYATGYKPGLHLDRIKSDQGYNPNNCQWLTPAQNAAKVTADANLRHQEELAALHAEIASLRFQLAELKASHYTGAYV